jgi:exodeoxyribonuclease-3
MKMISWNVNGLRASLKKGFIKTFSEVDADVFCLQETKMEQGQAELDFSCYLEYWNSAQRKGYSGTAVFTKKEPMNATFGLGLEKHDQEGRVITLEFEDHYLVNAYTPNSQRELTRLDYRMEWEDDFRRYLLALDAKKPVIHCGDLNVAHQEIDIKNAKSNRKNAGFTDQERDKMTLLLDSGFSDTFRVMHPEARDAYSWWSQMPGIRERNVGWRIDYFLVSRRFMPQVKEAFILSDVYGSDHCPVGIVI